MLYRGIVVENNDTELGEHRHLGRIKVRVDQVYGKDVDDEDLPWAWPCVPFGGGTVGEEEKISQGMICIPPKGASVWVAFEQDDPNNPVWLGTWYGKKNDDQEMPEEALNDSGASYSNIYVLKFPFGEKGIWMRCSSDQKLELVFEEDNVIQLDGLREQIFIGTKNWNIRAQTEQGSIDLYAENGNVWIRSGKDITLIAEGNIRAVAGETSHYHASGRNMFSSMDQIQGAAPAASGFEKHPV